MKAFAKAVIAGGSTLVLVMTLSGQQPAWAEEAPPYEPPPVQDDRSVPGEEIRELPPAPGPGEAGESIEAPAPDWPEPGVVEVDLSAFGARAGDLPVSLAAAPSPARQAPDRVRVEVLDRQQTAAYGVDGLLLRLRRSDGGAAAGRVELSVDYRDFQYAYGADWSSRLRLVRLSADGTAEVLPSRNDPAARAVSAVVDVAGASTMVAVAAGPAGSAGDYAASSLQPSSSWAVGESSGDFSWSYPMRVPPSLGGPAPTVQLAYSSQSVDGRMAASNNQPSWVGEGFESWPGFIERRYKPCGEDRGSGASNTGRTGDLCWATDNAFLSLNGASSELLLGADGMWHMRGEDGSRIERRTGAADLNRDNNGEHWVVTTADGTEFWFGRNRLPGWADGKAETASTWTVPVFGNHAGEPCYDATFANGSCEQAWRWNLDYVVDPSGNTMSMWYVKETNRYARNMTETNLAAYTRGGYLNRIDYGTRSDTAYGTAPMQVVYTPADRCLADCGTRNATTWPDTPWDLECTASPCWTGSPTFWSSKRLAKVTTVVGGSNVESWTFTHSFPDPGDGTRAGLWLARIAHAGHVGPAGTNTTVPDVTFVGVQRPNRVDGLDHSPAMNWWRLAHINTETGGSIAINYSDPDCAPGDVPSTLHSNTRRCYPVRWTPEGNTSPVQDYFHRYVVTSVQEVDMTGSSQRKLTTYEYLGAPAWHYTDDDGLVKAEYKTWSVWRGYDRVRTTVGEPGEQVVTETRYFRGMNGDRQPSGTRAVSLPAAGGAPALPDEDSYTGLARETIVYNGGTEVSAVVTEPWQSAATATRTLHGSTVNSRHVRVQVTRGRSTTHDGGQRNTLTRTTFDDHAMPIRVEDLGDAGTAGDDRCTLTDYARNTDVWLVSLPSRQRAFATDCTAATGGGLAEADIIADTRTSYDGQAFGAAPTRGLVTRVEAIRAWNQSTQTPSYLTTQASTYDTYGRVLTATDVRGNTTTHAYTPATGGPVTSATETNQLGWRTTTTLAPAWGEPTSEVDINGRRTDLTYDGLGRLTGVWLPGRDKAAGASASMTFAYNLRTNAPTVVTTSRLNASGGYTTSHELYDGLLRPRQTQAPEAGTAGGRIITDTFYDTAGRVAKTYDSYVADGAPSTSLFKPAGDNVVPAVTVTRYDAAGRTDARIFLSLGVEKWRTRFVHQGDRAAAIAPTGGTTSQVLIDARGRTSQLREFTSGSLSSNFETTTYTYDRQDRLTRVVDQAGNAWEYRYDLLGRQVWAKDPDRGVTTSAYNDAGDLLSTTDARGVTLAYTYDSLGRRTSLREGSASGTRRAEWTYDTLARGQLTTSTRWEAGNAYTTQVTGYTADYQPTGETYTVPASETGLAGSYAYTHTYRPDGSPSTTRLPDLDGAGGMPAETIMYGYNGQGRPATLSTNYTSTGEDAFYVNGTSYTRYGELAQLGLRFGTGKVANHTFYYQEGTRRLEKALVTRETGPSLVSDTRYGYDPAGNITRISEQVAGDHQCFGYDHRRRLTRAWTPTTGDCTAAPSVAGLGGPAPYWQNWTFNALGNRLTQTDHTGSGDRTTTYTYPATGSAQPHTLRSTSGAVTGSYTYDPIGNTLTRPAPGGGTQTLTWDREGHLATAADAAGTTSYVYDVDGERLVRRDPTGRTLYLPGQELRYTAASGAKATTRYYEHAGQTVAMRTTTGVSWLFEDHQDTATYAINSTSQQVTTRRHNPYGVARGSASGWPNDREFVGGTRDNTGLVHLGAREYDPAIGRFISVDPLIDHGDTEQVNGFTYANNTPVTMSDPDGLFPCISCLVNAIMSVYSSRKGIACRLTFGLRCGGGDRSGFGPRRVAKEVKRSVQQQIGKRGGGGRSNGRNKINNQSRRKVNQPAWGGNVNQLGRGCVPRPLNGCDSREFFEGLWDGTVKHLHEHVKVSLTVCDIVCASLEYQGGTVSLSTGQGGMGTTLSANYNSLPANEQGPVGYGACAARVVGACTGITQRVDPNTGRWEGFGWSAGGAIGIGVEGGSPGYNVASYDTKTGKWTGPQHPPPFTPVTCPIFNIC
jgi:RHS repeat-associated protein